MIIDDNPKNYYNLITNVKSWLDIGKEWFIRIDHKPNNQLFFYMRLEKEGTKQNDI